MNINQYSAIIFLLGVTNIVYGNEEQFVQIKNGVLRGKIMETRNARTFYSYTSIPYAKPPVGDLRFKPPVQADYWSGVLDATKIHDECPQRNIYVRSEVISGVEDCLYLNVYTPTAPTSVDNKKLLPVMIFIHGGGWLAGSGNTHWYGPDVLLDRDIVLVVPNYRLGALGFLTTGDEVVPGNNGLKDQTMALKWIKENIEKFGGDPNKVTIFGESAGGASAHLHMMSPLSKGLIHGAISESGTALCAWAFAPKGQGVRNGKKLAKALNCPTDSSQDMVDCLKKVDANTIIAQDKKFMEWDTDPMIPFKPVQEPKHKGAFIDEHPIDAIKSGNVENLPWMNGLNSDDGALRSAALYGSNLVKEFDADFIKLSAISLEFDETADNPDFVAKKLREFYFGDKTLSSETRKHVTDLFTDGWFLNGADQGSYLHRKYLKSPVYYYLFGHRGVASFTEMFGDKVNDYGVCHADELQYLFPVGDGLFPDKKPDEADKKVATLMTTLWANFAKYGNPTPEINEVCHEKWEPVQSLEEMEYFYIGGHENIKTKKGLFLERAKFWRNLPTDSRVNEIMKDEL